MDLFNVLADVFRLTFYRFRDVLEAFEFVFSNILLFLVFLLSQPVFVGITITGYLKK